MGRLGHGRCAPGRCGVSDAGGLSVGRYKPRAEEEILAGALTAALDWLARAQDAAANRGVAGGFSPGEGWHPASAGTTGGVISTFYFAARHLDRPQLAQCASLAAQWQVQTQLPSGAVRGA